MESQATLRTLDDEQESASKGLSRGDLTLVGDASSLAQGDETLQRTLVRLPVFQEETRCTRHGEDIGISCTDVCP